MSNKSFMAEIVLVDNGSLRADATRQLRGLARELGVMTGRLVHPVSLRHADQVPVEALEGEKAQIFAPFIEKSLAKGQRHFIVLPLFFGESRAIECLIRDYLQSLQANYVDLCFQIADVVCPLPQGEPLLASILYQHIMITAKKTGFRLENIVLVDHGSPSPQVNAVRQYLAKTLQEKLPAEVLLEQAVMERREGDKYLFNGELLKDWLIKKARSGQKTAIVSLLFFLAGRHAGAGGDIETICNEVMADFSDFSIAISPLIVEHEALRVILQARLQVCLDRCHQSKY